MEAILILTELCTPFAHEELLHVSGDAQFRGDERRQAAVWGLGKIGLQAYGDLVEFINDDEENMAFHAISAFGTDTPKAVIEELIAILLVGEPQKAPAASEALRGIGTNDVLQCLIKASEHGNGSREWVLATIGRLPPAMVRAELQGTALLDQLAPMLLIAEGANWLATEEANADITFLQKQNL